MSCLCSWLPSVTSQQLLHITYTFWLTLITIVAITLVSNWLNTSGSYGKLCVSSSSQSSFNPSTVSWLSRLNAAWFSERYMYAHHIRAFSVYYTTSVLFNLTCFSLLLLRASHTHSLKTPHQVFALLRQDCALTVTLLFLLLFTLHTSRRFYECLFIQTSASQARQHHIVTVVGSLYYVFIPLTLAAEYWQWKSSEGGETEASVAEGLSKWLSMYWTMIRLLLGIVVFVYGNYKQHCLHLLLARLRDNDKQSLLTKLFPSLTPSTAGSLQIADSHYSIPHSDWFRFAWCAHYTAEITLYCGLMILLLCREMGVSKGFTLILLMAAENLTLTALKTKSWYNDLIEKSIKDGKLKVQQQVRDELSNKAAMWPSLL